MISDTKHKKKKEKQEYNKQYNSKKLNYTYKQAYKDKCDK